jgi:hypothetical protein
VQHNLFCLLIFGAMSPLTTEQIFVADQTRDQTQKKKSEGSLYGQCQDILGEMFGVVMDNDSKLKKKISMVKSPRLGSTPRHTD